MAAGCVCAAWARGPAPLTDLHAIHQLTNAEASHALPVVFEATVTYFRPYERTMFVQDGDVAIYVQSATDVNVVAGDRILIKGTTQPSFRPFVLSSEITFLRHGALPKPVAANYEQLIRAQVDCMLVTVHATVRAANIVTTSDVPSASLQMHTDGGHIDAVVDSADAEALKSLLDAEVEITGAASGRFDGKMQQTGILLHVSSLADIKVVRRIGASPWALPVTRMDEILTGYHVTDLTQRVRVQGTITYYEPGSAVVLQSGSKSLWIRTQTHAPLHVDDLADATGFPGLHDGFLTLTDGEVQGKNESRAVAAHASTWRQLSESRNVFDLVSIEAQVVMAARESSQDEYVMASDGEMFSAIYRHPPAGSPEAATLGPMKQIPAGSVVRVTGICILEDSNPFNAQVPFNILMRGPDDLNVIARPSMLNILNLVRMVGVLLLVVLLVGAWAWTMRRKVARQTAALARRIDAEAALERRMAQLEQRRSRILEDINGPRPLAEILEGIAEAVSFRLNGAPVWCEVAGGARLGSYPADTGKLREIREESPSRSGPPLGVLYAALDPALPTAGDEAEALFQGARLASLAIETRRLYSDLRHRSEFDLLTDIHNRFSLDKHLEMLIAKAREEAGVFGLIYIDLDEFKQVNDLYGHRVGDLYLQEVASRMKRQLRGGDMLARLGGDEFAAVMPAVGSRAHAEEIAQRLERSFDAPFEVDGYVLHGSASVGIALCPEDGTTKDSLLSAADAAMYVAKHTRAQSVQHLADRRHGDFSGRDRS